MPHDFSDPVRTLQKFVALLRNENGTDWSEYISRYDLENELGWMAKLDELTRRCYSRFETVNETFFRGTLPRPTIIFTNRATGGFYDPRTNRIAISLPMAIECGLVEIEETLLHEIAHMKVLAHDKAFYELLATIGGSGRKAPATEYLLAKRTTYAETKYPIKVRCPNCGVEGRYKTRRALRYACKRCCQKFSAGEFDSRFQFVIA